MAQATERLSATCLGLTEEMLEDLLTPDEQPEGASYDDGRIRLASAFSVEARQLREKLRGKPQVSGVLIFRPVELLASRDWLVTCWHPPRTFSGAEAVEFAAADTKPASAADVLPAIASQWQNSSVETGGDLGVLVMGELAISYSAAVWALQAWLQDWELGLYVDDQLDNPDELKRLWGEMAILRDWLTALNLPGLRKSPEKAWLPVSRHEPVIDVDDRIDKALDRLGRLSETMRASFSILHVQKSEEERERREHLQQRIERMAAIFLVPTLIVGFYGANTWVPGQGKHWGFWVMVAVLLLLSVLTVALLLRWQRAQREESNRIAKERQQLHRELLRQASRT